MSADRCPTCDREGCPFFPPVNSYSAKDDCEDHAVDWRAEALTLRTRCLAAEAARDEATRRLAEEKATVAAQSLDLFGALDAQAEATRRLAVVEEAVRVARKSIGVLVDHFEAMGGEEDSSQLAYDLQAISDGLRAALEKQP